MRLTRLPRFRAGRTLLTAAGGLLLGCQAPVIEPPVIGIDEAGVYDDAIATRIAELSASMTKVYGYRLPWAKGVAHRVWQYPHGYRAQIWHAIDFDLGWEEVVLAARPGRLSVVQEGFDDYDLGTRCQQKECNRTTNFLVIQHDDGKESSYLHLRKGSVSALGLKQGDEVCQGQPVARIGHNGYTSGPHLHISVQDSGSTTWTEMFSKPTHQIIFDETAPEGVAQDGRYASQNERGPSCRLDPPASPCSGKGDGGYCGRSLPGYGGSGDDLVTCGGGRVASTRPCGGGCQSGTPGSEACKAPPTSPCAGRANGKYCGGTLAGYSGGGSDLVLCSGGAVASAQPCPAGCQVNPPGVPDACKAPPASPCAGKMNGWYCGGTLAGYGGGGSDLVLCSGGAVASTRGCPHGCQVNPPGTDDVCKPAPASPCAGKMNGKYCGSTLPGYSGAGSDLVTCGGGAVIGAVACPRGCQVNPPGVADACK